MSHHICGHCEHFTHVKAPRIAEGEGRCLGYGDLNPEPLVQWDHRATVLFGPIKDRVARDRRVAWIQQMRDKESADGTADAAPASSAGPPGDERNRVAITPPTLV